MDLSKYPITTPFGWVQGYPLNRTDPVNHPGAGFHNGIDYGVPMNTPVVVNGVEIARSNNTGASTGPHLHVGKYQGGAAVNPGVGNGTQFGAAVVFDTGHDAVNGNYVRIMADGALWNYLHLADGSIKVKAGQVLKGSAAPGEKDMPITKEMEMSEAYKATGSYPGSNYNYRFVGTTDYNGMLSFWQGQMRLITAAMEHQLADGLASTAAGRQVSGYIGSKYNSPYVGKPVVSYYDRMTADWIGKVRADKNLHSAPAAAGFSAADRAQAAETNTIVKSISAAVNKLISFWKV